MAEPLRLFGSEEQKRKWLPLVAKDHISAFLLTEPEAGSDPARMGAVATPVYDDIVATPVEGGYSLSGRKLWATNGTIADITVVMAKVPESEGHRGGISAFVMPYDSEGVTVEHRNAFMGLHGIENSVTLLDNVFVPEENRIAREGDGLKIALSTLNTGRLGVMASAVGTAKWSTKIAREWAVERAQWGRSIGKHDAVAQMVAFIAGSAFGMEAMLDVVGRLADNKANDVRTEAAMCKVYGAELGWRVIDTLVQLRGGRGYETAASLKSREAIELAELFCGQAKGRAETLFSALWSNRDDANYAAAQEVLAGRYVWLEDRITDPSGDGPMMPPLDDPAAARDEVASSPDATAAAVTRPRN